MFLLVLLFYGSKFDIYFAGLLTAIHKERLSVINYRELLFNDCGDRVAQLLHVQSVNPILQNQKDSVHQEFLIVNTHLLFPHDSSLSIVRLDQVCEFAAIQNSFLFSFFFWHLSILKFSFHLSTCRFIKYYNMWNCIREKTGSNRCLLFYAGEFIVGFLVMLLLLLSQMSLCCQLHVLSNAAIGTEASVDMFTNSLGRRVSYHHMILQINILIVLQMHTR